MKKKSIKNLLIAVLCIAALCLPVSSANPGSADDPLITKSYIDSILMPQVKSYVDSQISSVESSGSGVDVPVASGATMFNIVNVSKNQTIIGGKSCQMILRMGTGTIVATSKGGVCDVTSGVDLANGVAVPSNHLLIVPLDDGRGIKMTADGIIMISGSYSVKQ